MLGQDSRQYPQSDRGGKLFSAGSVHHHLRRRTGVQENGQQNRQGSAQFVAEKGEARASRKSLEFRLVGSLQRRTSASRPKEGRWFHMNPSRLSLDLGILVLD